MSAETIYRQLIQASMTPAGACGLMGNMQAESGMKSNIAQRGMTVLSDEEYTAASAEWPVKFIHDGVGYGLCQWTYWSRKQALLSFARARGVSVGDEGMQVEFCVDELRDEYPALWCFLCETQDVRAAAERVCREYERPAVNNVDVRTEYANQFYSRLGGLDVTEPTGETEAKETCWPPRVICEGMNGSDVAVAQALLRARGIDCPATGVFEAQTHAAVLAFQAQRGLACDGIAGGMTWRALLERARP